MSLRLMPQELEVWYLLPALRRELSKMFINLYWLNQKETAEILGITESAVSQYLKDKRANELRFDRHELKIIKDTADRILKDRKNSLNYLYSLSVKLRGTRSLCEFHKKHDFNLPSNCRLCKV
ncbi:MAG: transcriptional regulator [Candidatus Pacearchaeota archaeon]